MASEMQPVQAGALRVMTLNIWNYNEPWTRRRDLIVEAVRQVGPHVIGFQEIRHDGRRDEGGRNQAEQLADRLPGYGYIYRPAQRNPETDQWEGLAVFSRLPFVSSSCAALSRDPEDTRDGHQRVVLHAEIHTAGGPVHFFDTHLSLSAQARDRTAREIARFISRYPSGRPHILVGDLNATPDEGPVAYLTGEAGLTDAWATADGRDTHGGADPGITFDCANPYTKQTEGGRRIDYVLLSQEAACRLVACRRVADRPADDGHLPSDHYGLAADLQIASPSSA